MRVSAALPPPLEKGDRVGVAALSGPVDETRLAAGLQTLEALGYRPVEAANLRSRTGFLAGTDQERLAAFHELASDPEVKAIFFARGGYGVPRILPEIDWELLARFPRAYVGYSDLTPFLLGIVERLGLVSFHGPMVAADMAGGLSRIEADSLQACLAGRFPQVLPLEGCEAGESTGGLLLGGCLSLLVSLLGTPYATDLNGSILFLEDVDEPPYRFDRMLTHLRLSGTLDSIEGLVVGHLSQRPRSVGLEKDLDDRGSGSQVDPAGSEGRVDARSKSRDKAEATSTLTALHPLLVDLATSFRWSLAWGLEAGHNRPNRTLPLGCQARLEPSRKRLILAPEAGELR